MLKVTLEVLPSDGSEKKLIGYMYIENLEKSDTFLADYKVSLSVVDSRIHTVVQYYQDHIRKFSRSRGPWDLVREALITFGRNL